MTDHEARLEELAARVEIAQVILRLARGTDRRDRELMLACYHPDATDDHNMFRGSARDFAELVSTSDPAMWVATSHTTSPPLVELRGDVAWAETTAVGFHVGHADTGGSQAVLLIGCRYEDRFECRSGEWRIAHRTVIYDWAGQSALVPGDRPSRRMPFPDDFVVGTRDASDPSYVLRLEALR
ncbi:nuclear transport factor 2 family protein [Longivirga aurantiaca]|uniref:Nuclear transport factor 2 family protein n=1 Tax=Longivirga aurantiaca TaxID=1837743 RepID=A0ABW1T4P4_9ACTN